MCVCVGGGLVIELNTVGITVGTTHTNIRTPGREYERFPVRGEHINSLKAMSPVRYKKEHGQ